MLSLSCLLIFLGIVLHKSNAVSNADLQKLCEGKRYGTLVPNPNDCNSFYVCQFIVQLTKCDIGLHFDRKHKVCNWPQFAGCDWVEPEGSTSEEIVTPVRPDKPNTPVRPDKPNANDEKYPNKPSEESDNNGVTENDMITRKPQHPEVDPSNSSEENHDNQHKFPSTVGDMIIDEIQTPGPLSAPSTVGDMIIDEIQTPSLPFAPATVDDMLIDEIQTPRTPSAPATVDDMIIEEIQTPRPPTAPSTVGDIIIDEIQTPGPPSAPSTVDDYIIDELHTPSSPSAENQDNQPNFPPTIDSIITEPTPDLPKPNHPQRPPAPPIIEEVTDQQSSEGNQNSSEKLPPIDGDKPAESPKPPNIDENDNIHKPDAEGSIDLSTAGGHSSHHWNLIASIVSVESSHTDDGFINHPTVGAHSPETGYPVDVMTGYDPKNVQCLHSGLYFLPHPSNCQKYFICAYRHLHLHSCGDGVIWNHKRGMCDLKGNAKCYSRDAESEDNTELPTPFIDDQTRKTTKAATRRPAKKTTKFLAATTLSHKLPMCPATLQVYMPNLDDCHKYYICIMGKAVLTSCPSGMHWDAVGEFCGPPSVVRCVHR